MDVNEIKINHKRHLGNTSISDFFIILYEFQFMSNNNV